MSQSSEIISTVWNIQNELRNKEGITGLEALHHINLMLLARSLTPDQCKKLNISEDFAFENMINLNAKDLYDKFYNRSNQRSCLVYHIRNGGRFGFDNTTPFQIKHESTLQYIYSKMNNLPIEELFKKKSKTSETPVPARE